MEKFKSALGGSDNYDTPGPLPDGYRSINWDDPSIPFRLPFNYFNTKSMKRGAVFRSKGGAFVVSNPSSSSGIVDDRFSSILGERIATMFQPYSPPRLFSPLKSNLVKVVFRTPGKIQRAVTSGFGAVFCDVDFANSEYPHKWSSVTFLDAKGCVIERVAVPHENFGLSFVGLVVVDEKRKPVAAVQKVKIELGNYAINKVNDTSGIVDFVVMDDVFFGEPQRY